MRSLKLALMLQAQRRHGTLCRCGTRATLWDGFRVQRGRLEFYFNDSKGNTHMIWAASDFNPSLAEAAVF